jgi:hypothetical protein
MPAATWNRVRLNGVVQIMADTGENRQIVGRANAKEAQTVRASKRAVSEERSTEKAGNAAFRNGRKVSQHKSKGTNSGVLIPKLRRSERRLPLR